MNLHELQPQRVSLEMLQAVLDRHAILAAVRQSFVDHANGTFVQSAPMHLTFPRGECHIKAGFPRNGDTFTIKIVSGFYGNEALGLPSGSGLQLLADQHTGAPLALFEDRGFLTAWRTAAATVLAAEVAQLIEPVRLGIVGAGLQAQLAATWIPLVYPVAELRVWGRDEAKTRAKVAQWAGARVERSLETLCRQSNLIITATPAEQPLVRATWIEPGTHIVALGADQAGKNEIEPALFGRCSTIVTDDHTQCLAHGDFGVAVRAGCADEAADITLGTLLRDAPPPRMPNEITIADLTGLAVQDHAIGSVFYRLLVSPTARRC